MDALSALSVASSVLQIVDFTRKLISKGRKIYKSADGALLEHKDQEAAAVRLNALSEELSKGLQGRRQKVSVPERALQEVGYDCQKVTNEFTAVLGGFRVTGKHRGWKSFRQAFKSIWSKDQIARMSDKLQSIQGQVSVHLLVVISQYQEQDLRTVQRDLGSMEDKILKEIDKANVETQKEVAGMSRRLLSSASPLDWRGVKAYKQTQAHSVNDFVIRMSNTAEDEHRRRIDQMLLDSLYFTQIAERSAKISPAHSKTFQWILDDSDGTKSGSVEFVAWCRGQGINQPYWISGKPGSGKSTLMRFLFHEERTKAYLQAWAGSRRLILASCFFWISGTTLQKSLSGMLRSLLHEVLQHVPHIAGQISPTRWRLHDYGISLLDGWNESELHDAFRSLVAKLNDDLCLCLFIDGLDEFDGEDAERGKLIDLLKDLTSSSNVKVCLSSRPWLIFQDAFEQGPKLRLQDLTRHDITIYVQDTLEMEQKFQDLSIDDPESCRQLVAEIVEKAHGLFLWVFLVVRSLKQGLRKEDGIVDLRRRLRDMPGNLEDFFDQMMMTIEPMYRVQASTVFRLVMDSEEPLPLMMFFFLREARDHFGITEAFQAASTGTIQKRLLIATRWLESRCKGFLEVHLSNRRGLILKDKVDYLHRTVRDFLVSTRVQKTLDESRDSTFDPCMFKSQALLALIKMSSIKISSITEAQLDSTIVLQTTNDIYTLTADLIAHLDVYMLRTAQLPIQLLLHLDRALRMHSRTQRECYQATATRPTGDWWTEPQVHNSFVLLSTNLSDVRGTSDVVSMTMVVDLEYSTNHTLLEYVLWGPLRKSIRAEDYLGATASEKKVWNLDGRLVLYTPNVKLLKDLLSYGHDPTGQPLQELRSHSSPYPTLLQLWYERLELLYHLERECRMPNDGPQGSVARWQVRKQVTEILLASRPSRWEEFVCDSRKVLEMAFSPEEASRLRELAGITTAAEEKASPQSLLQSALRHFQYWFAREDPSQSENWDLVAES